MTSKEYPNFLQLNVLHSIIVFSSTLLSRGLKCNDVIWYSNTPLILAAERGNVQVIKLLLEAGCDVNRSVFDPLHCNSAYHVTADQKIKELFISDGDCDCDCDCRWSFNLPQGFV